MRLIVLEIASIIAGGLAESLIVFSVIFNSLKNILQEGSQFAIDLSINWSSALSAGGALGLLCFYLQAWL